MNFLCDVSLNEQESRIFKYILRGMANKEIAYEEKMALSEFIYKLFGLYKKIGVKSRYELIAQERELS